MASWCGDRVQVPLVLGTSPFVLERGELCLDLPPMLEAGDHRGVTSPLAVWNLTVLPLGRWMVVRAEAWRMRGRAL